MSTPSEAPAAPAVSELDHPEVAPRVDGPTARVPRRAAPPAVARPPVADRALVAAVVAVLVPIAVATIRALRRGWEPVGDNAYFLLRARDAFTSHHPLLGTWTSASQNTDTNFNNPGPLLFDLWAIPAKLGGGTGLAIGVAITNGLCVVGIALMVRRRSGPLVAIAAMGVTGLLCWTLGSELLYDPWQPHSLLLPFMFLLTCVWSASAGDLGALPWMFGVASLVVQTHLSYAVIVVALVSWGLLGSALAWRRGGRADIDGELCPRNRRRLVSIAGITVLVVAACWAQPLHEEFTSSGQGNLSRLAANASGSVPAIGVRTGTRVVADTAVVPPFWLRPSFKDDLVVSERPGAAQLDSVSASFPVSAALLVGLGLVMAATAWEARRRGDIAAASGLVTAVVALVSGLFTAWKLPNGIFGVVPHQFRWLWPASAFATLALVAYLIGRFATREARARPLTLLMALVAVGVAVATLPTYSVGAGPSSDVDASPTMKAAARQMGAFAGKGPILIDLQGIALGEPYSGPVMAELQRRNIPFVADDPVLVRQIGDSRRLTRPSRALLFGEGDGALPNSIPDAHRVVYVAGLKPAQQRERIRLREEVVTYLTDVGVRVNGEVARRFHVKAGTIPRAGNRPEMYTFVIFGTLRQMVEAGVVSVDQSWRTKIERYGVLDKRWSHTLGLFLSDKPRGSTSAGAS